MANEGLMHLIKGFREIYERQEAERLAQDARKQQQKNTEDPKVMDDTKTPLELLKEAYSKDLDE